MALRSKLRSARWLLPLATALLLAALVAVPSSGTAQAQAPPGDELTLVNADRDFVERKKGGEFVARPVFDRKITDLFYAIRDADTGDWISAMYRVKGGEKKRNDGWEYSWEYPDLGRDRLAARNDHRHPVAMAKRGDQAQRPLSPRPAGPGRRHGTRAPAAHHKSHKRASPRSGGPHPG